MAGKLKRLLEFDSAVFFIADLSKGLLVAEHVVGESGPKLVGLSLPLEQKLTGWVAANNQALCNLPPFPDFLACSEPRPSFQISAITPMNRQGAVIGAISLYRLKPVKFSEEEFRRLEIMGSQTAIALSKCADSPETSAVLFDTVTGIPNGFQLFLMFEQVAMDAMRYSYPLAIFYMRLDELKLIDRRWGPLTCDEVIRAVSKHLAKEVRETDLLVRYAADEFIALSPKMSREQAEALKSRLQDVLDHFQFVVRSGVEIPLRTSIGIAILPEDGASLESMLGVAEWQMRQDSELRSVSRRVRRGPSSIKPSLD
jgi:diguanylate cyclase (GGDEF)-like protein